MQSIPRKYHAAIVAAVKSVANSSPGDGTYESPDEYGDAAINVGIALGALFPCTACGEVHSYDEIEYCEHCHKSKRGFRRNCAKILCGRCDGYVTQEPN